jgi:hypothetical protein
MNWIAQHWQIVAASVVGVYETLARIIPTIGTWSVVAKVINLLKIISDSLDRKK